MKIFNKKLKVESVLKDILCDSCGKSCKIILSATSDGHDSIFNYEFIEMSARWGYGTPYDGEDWKAYICLDCVKTKLSFINFEKSSYITDADIGA